MQIKSLIATVAIATSVPAAAHLAAEQWYRIGGNANTASYVDKGSIVRSGNGAKAWVMTVMAKPINDRVWSARIYYDFDCAARFYRSLRYVHLGAKGEVLSDHASTTSEQRRVPEKGAISEGMFDFVCSGTGGDLVANPDADARQAFAED